jgi:hypothetical protein
MPGTMVRDALAPNLLAGATLNAAGTSNGTVVQIDKPGDVRFLLTIGTATGTTPTLDLEVKGADDLAFTVNVVSYGRFSSIAGGVVGSTRVMDADVFKRYIRATPVIGGTTPSYAGSTLQVVIEHDRRVAATDTA